VQDPLGCLGSRPGGRATYAEIAAEHGWMRPTFESRCRDLGLQSRVNEVKIDALLARLLLKSTCT
jgi:hypothetical protein